MQPATQFAKVGEDFVAYQVIGDGAIDLVYVFGWEGHVEAQWDYPALARFLMRLASFSRLIVFNRRGHGMSDPIDLDNITLEQWMEDMLAVMDAADSERAVLVGGTEGGPMAMMYAATHPERTTALVLANTFATMRRYADYPAGLPHETLAATLESLTAMQGSDLQTAVDFYSLGAHDRGDGEHTARLFRYAASPGMARRFIRHAREVDVRGVLASVRVPTLVLHRSGLDFVRPTHGRYLADHIPQAKYVEVPGDEFFLWWGDQDAVLDEIQEFVTGVRPIQEPDRVLATVLFTDVVASTERTVAIGDRRWRDLLEAHNEVVRRELGRHNGREVSTAGDGFLATFDGPARAVRCACSIVDGVRELGLDVRAGLHTGEIELVGSDVAGIAIHIGSRVQDLAGPCEVLVSRTVVDLVAGSGLSFTERGAHSLKGVPGEWQLYAVER